MSLCFDSNIFVIGGTDSLQWQIQRSADGGHTWSFIGNFDYFWSFGKIDDKPQSAFFLTQFTQKLIMTDDAGKTWEEKKLPSNDFDSLTILRKLFFYSADSA
jgi:hypothetical protein